MSRALTIILIIVVLGMIISLFEWISEHIILTLFIAFSIVGLIFVPEMTLYVLGIITLGYGCYQLWSKVIRAKVKKTMVERELQKKDELAEKQKAEELSKLPVEARTIISELERNIDVITKQESLTVDQAMLDILEDFKTTVIDLDKKVKERPEVSSKLQKVVNYYLPTVNKLLNKYRDYAENEDENSNQIKQKIKNSVATLDKAMEKLLLEINTVDDWDVLADISVMEQMIERDGLSSSDDFMNSKI